MHYILLICVNRFSPVSRVPVFPFSPVPALSPVFVLTGGHMAGNRPGGPRSKEARFYSVKGMNTNICFICLTLLLSVVYRWKHERKNYDSTQIINAR